MEPTFEQGAIANRAHGAPRLYTVKATLPDSPKAVLAILHGYADHATRYRHVMTELGRYAIASVALDMRGHGKSEGVRGFCSNFSEFLDDAAELRRLAAEHASGAPVFLLGHSFGGLVATRSLMNRPEGVRGLLLSAPFFGLALQVPQLKVIAGKIASRVIPALALPSGLSGRDMTHDEAQARAYDTDPLRFSKATARWFTETQQAQRQALAAAASMNLPVRVTFGTSDKVASLQAARELFDALSSADKTFDEQPNLYHEVLNEPEWKDIVGAMAKWMLARTVATDLRR